jgi:Family of unknown function (DUF6345)
MSKSLSLSKSTLSRPHPGRCTMHTYRCAVLGCAFSILACTVAMTTTTMAQATPYWRDGVRCQNDFQNGWLPTISTYGMCSDFINDQNSDIISSVLFYYNLQGAKPDIENTNNGCIPCGGADTVDLFLLNSHGGVNSSNAALAMWDLQTDAWSNNMLLTADHLSVLAMYACDVLETADGDILNRWQATFKSGLKEALGAYDLVYDGNDQKGTEFSSRIDDGEPVGFSWNEAVWYADNSNHPIAVTVGLNATDCATRRQAPMTTIVTNAHLGNQEAWICWSTWN